MHPQAIILRFRILAVGAGAEHVGSRQVGRDVDAVLMATGDDLFQILPVLVLVLDRPAAAPCDPDPVKLRLLEQPEHLLEIAIIDVGQYILLLGVEFFSPPGPLGLLAFNPSAIQPDETKTPLLRPRWHVLRLGAI